MLMRAGMASLGLLVLILISFCAFVSGDLEFPRAKADALDGAFFHFVTRPDIQAPKYNVSIHDKEAVSPGYWFVAIYDNIHKLKQGHNWEGPYIYDWKGDLVWAGSPSMDYYMINDFRVQRYNNTDMLTGISFRDNAGLFWNNHYEIVKSVSWTDEWAHSNMHEFQLVDDGTRALAATRNRFTKLSLEQSRTVGFEGNCSVKADGFREVDITVDPPRVVFDWVGIDHIPIVESVKNRPHEEIIGVCEDVWDLHHINSLDKFANGDYLVSSRTTDTIYRISHLDGSIVWRLGRWKSDFPMKGKTQFGAQHLVRVINETEKVTTISIFANGRPKHSAGMIVELDLERKTMELIQEAPHPEGDKHVGSRGGAQLLPNGHMVTCQANYGRVAEHDRDGNLLSFARLVSKPPQGSLKLPTYRGFKFEWVGKPKYPPTVYSAAFSLGTDRLETAGRRIVTHVFVSWNGATEVAEWKLYESNARGTELKEIGSTKKNHFESEMIYDGYAEHVVVAALDSNNNQIGLSHVFKTIASIEEGGPKLNYTITAAAPVLDSEQNSQADEDGGFDTDYEVGYADGYDFDLGVDHGLDDKDWLNDDPWWKATITSPIFTYIAGFATCAGMWIGVWGFERMQRRSHEKKGPKYETLDTGERESVFFEKADDDEHEEDLELMERSGSPDSAIVR